MFWVHLVFLDNLKAFLVKNKIEHEFLEKECTHHAEEASREAGIPLDRIAKTLVFMDKENNPVIAIVRADASVSRHKLEKASARKDLGLAKPELAEKATGYPTGGIPPIGHKKKHPIFMDKHVRRMGNVWAGGGARTKLVNLKVSDILKFGKF